MSFFLKNLSQSFFSQYVSSRPIFDKTSSVFSSIVGPLLQTKKRQLFTVNKAIEKTQLFSKCQKNKSRNCNKNVCSFKHLGKNSNRVFTIPNKIVSVPAANYKTKSAKNILFKDDNIHTNSEQNIDFLNVKSRSKIKRFTPTEKIQQITKVLNGTWVSEKCIKFDFSSKNYNFKQYKESSAPIKVDNDYNSICTSLSDQPVVIPSIRKFSNQAFSDDETQCKSKTKQRKQKKKKCSKSTKAKTLHENSDFNCKTTCDDNGDLNALAECLKNCLVNNKIQTFDNGSTTIKNAKPESKSDNCKPCSSKKSISDKIEPTSENQTLAIVQHKLIKRIENLEREFYDIKKTTSQLSNKHKRCMKSPNLNKKLPITKQDKSSISKSKTLLKQVCNDVLPENKNKHPKNKLMSQSKANKPKLSCKIRSKSYQNSKKNQTLEKQKLENGTKTRKHEDSKEKPTKNFSNKLIKNNDDVSCEDTKKYKMKPPCNLEVKNSEIDKPDSKTIEDNDKLCECNQNSEKESCSKKTEIENSSDQIPIMQCIALCHKKKQTNVPLKSKRIPPNRDKKPSTDNTQNFKKLVDFKAIQKTKINKQLKEFVPCKNEQIKSLLKTKNAVKDKSKNQDNCQQDEAVKTRSNCKTYKFDDNLNKNKNVNNDSDSCVCSNNKENDKNDKLTDCLKKGDKNENDGKK